MFEQANQKKSGFDNPFKEKHYSREELKQIAKRINERETPKSAAEVQAIIRNHHGNYVE